MTEIYIIIHINISGHRLVTMTADGAVYVINQDGFATALKRPLIFDEMLNDLVWSVSDPDDEGIIDLIGISDTSVYIWDPIQNCEPMELRYQFDENTKITCIDASSMTNHLFVVGTSTGLAFTHNFQSTPLQVHTGAKV